MEKTYKNCRLFINNVGIRVIVDQDNEIFVCLFDIMKMLKRSDTMRISEPQKVCAGMIRLPFQSTKNSELYGIPISDIYRVSNHYKKEGKAISKRCIELDEWAGRLHSVVSFAKPMTGSIAKIDSIDIIENIDVFAHADFGNVRCAYHMNEPLFVGRDIAIMLKYKSPSSAVRTLVDDEDKKRVHIATAGGNQEVTMINESGMYSLILRSELPSAKKMQRWVTSEVLPQIRKTGGFIPVKKEDTDTEILAKAHLILEKTIANLQNQLQLDQPKVEYYEEMVENRDYFTTTSIANELRISAQNLNKLLLASEICEIGKYNKLVATPEFSHLQVSVPYIWGKDMGKPYNRNNLMKWNKEGREFIIKIFKDGIR